MLAFIHHKVISSLSSECVVIITANRRPEFVLALIHLLYNEDIIEVAGGQRLFAYV